MKEFLLRGFPYAFMPDLQASVEHHLISQLSGISLHFKAAKNNYNCFKTMTMSGLWPQSLGH